MLIGKALLPWAAPSLSRNGGGSRGRVRATPGPTLLNERRETEGASAIADRDQPFDALSFRWRESLSVFAWNS